MIIVALPVWLAHELLLRRAAANHSDETGSTLRKLYVHGALFLTTLYAAFGSIQIIEQLAGDFDGLEHIGGVIVAAGLWYYLWRRENLEGQPSPRAQTVKRWRIYGLSVIFLTAAVTATYWIALALAYAVYEFATGASDTLLGPEDIEDPLRTAAAWALVGTVAWAVQWQAVATRDEESVLRQVYLYGFAFVGGAALALWGASATIYVVIAQLVRRGLYRHGRRLLPTIHTARRRPSLGTGPPRLPLVNNPPTPRHPAPERDATPSEAKHCHSERSPNPPTSPTLSNTSCPPSDSSPSSPASWSS